MKEILNRNIIDNSYYVIFYFSEKGQKITNLRLQKLMYFLEAIYMTITDEPYLFDEKFEAWSFGPVCRLLYRHYSTFEDSNIELLDAEKERAKHMPDLNQRYIEILFKLFGDMSASQLVNLTHRPDSPWSMVYINDLEYDTVVSKEATKEWFCKLFKISKETK